MDERLFGDPEHLYPDGVDGPTVDVPSVSPGQIWQTEVLRLFVLQVVVWNAILLVLSVGSFLIYFNDDWSLGSQLLVVGALLVLYSMYRWPRRDGGT